MCRCPHDRGGDTMSEAVAGISFNLEYDESKMMTSISSACDKIKKDFTKSFSDAGKSAKTHVEISNNEIQAILDDTARSAKSKAAAIAAIYKKEGDSASDAMTKAWSHIKRESKSSEKSIKKDMENMSKQSWKTGHEVNSNLSSSFVSIAKKAAIAFAAAFSVKKIVDFGKECIELGSDLEEVQNVVDVTFPKMSSRVNEFAQNAAASFGLSETMAKKFTGTFGAMAKAFGFSEKAAYDMSSTLTGLAGDVASFYNITQDEAYTKLKSVFTGETESLKDLGVVMTQTALDAYALANGYGKTTSAMSEAEKVALRYAFVQDQLTAAAGDFSRTSDGWANQIRILSLQFDSLKATIGQGLINVLTPVIKIINTLVGKLMTLANAFRSFTEYLTAKKGGSEAAVQMQAIADTADKAAASTEAIGDAAAASAKKMKGLFAFDEMNVVDQDSASGSGSSAGDYSADSFDFGEIDDTAIEEADQKYQALLDKVAVLGDLFRQGFQSGFGDTGVFDSIQQSIISIKDSFTGIFMDSEVLGAANNFLDTFIDNLGVRVGAFLSVGASIADNILGGISQYLTESTGKIQDYLVSMFGVGSRISEIRGNLSAATATIFESLRSDGAKSCTEALVGILGDAFMGITEILGTLQVDILDMITAPLIKNQDVIKTTLENTFSVVAPILEECRGIINDVFSTLQTTYEEHIHPMFAAFRDGFTEIASVVMDVYNKYMLPVIKKLGGKFSEFRESTLSPLIDKFGEFAGKVADAVEAVWTNALKPAIEQFINDWGPVIASVIDVIGSVIMDVGAVIGNTLGSVLDALGGLMDFITGVFTGDWELAWEGIKDFFCGIWDALTGWADDALQAIWDIIDWALNGIRNVFSEIWEKISDTVLSVLTSVKTFITSTFNNIYSNISNILAKLKKVWSDGWTCMKTIVVNIFNGIWTALKKVINSILGGIEGMANGIARGLNKAIEAMNRISFDIPDWVPSLGGKSFGFNVPAISEISIPRLAQGGYVKANTPQLAMIGDNRHQGEIVAPEDKIYQISAQAMKDVMQQFISALTVVMGNAHGDKTIVIRVTGEMAPFVRLLKMELEKEGSREGINFEVVCE